MTAGSMKARAPLLYMTALVVATAGLVYELLAGALSSHRLGDSVTQFSTTIGAYLFAMGIGAYLSRFVKKDIAQRFVEVELTLALFGGFEAPILWFAAGYAELYRVVLYGLVGGIGTLVGLEIPLLMRMLKEHLAFEEIVSKVLTFDYLGALAGSLLFALVLVPMVGMLRTSLLFGLLNATVAIGTTWVLAELLGKERIRLRILGGALTLALLTALFFADKIENIGEAEVYGARIMYAEQTPYQRIVITQGRGGIQLHLNGNLQFNTTDEYRYHEALVHPAFAVAPRHARVLVLGGGDGLAVREILRYADVRHVTLVDLDAAITNLARRSPVLRELNHDSLGDPRVHVINDDAMVWLDERGEHAPKFDVVVVDFPDPNNFAVGKLYTTRFYRLLARALVDDGMMVVQSTSPLFARRSFWCIERTIAASGFSTRPYHTLVPSFGEWGYVLAGKRPFDEPSALGVSGLRFLNDRILPSLFVFGEDMKPVPVEINRLNDQQLVHYYDREWGTFE